MTEGKETTEMTKLFALLAFLTLGMRPFGWSVEDVRVTEVRQGLVTMVGADTVYQSPRTSRGESATEPKPL